MLTKIKMRNIPIGISIEDVGKDLMITYEGDVYQVAENPMDEKKYKNYLKELKALFKDLDDIFGEINAKYNIK